MNESTATPIQRPRVHNLILCKWNVVGHLQIRCYCFIWHPCAAQCLSSEQVSLTHNFHAAVVPQTLQCRHSLKHSIPDRPVLAYLPPTIISLYITLIQLRHTSARVQSFMPSLRGMTAARPNLAVPNNQARVEKVNLIADVNAILSHETTLEPPVANERTSSGQKMFVAKFHAAGTVQSQ